MKPPAYHPEFHFRADAKAARLAADVTRVIEILRGQGWCTAKRLMEINAGLKLSERRLRIIAAASDAAIISWPGSPGYRLFDDTSEAEIDHAVRAHSSQIHEMQTRLGAILRRHHRRHLTTNIGGETRA